MHCHACWPRFCHDTLALLALNFYGVACTNNNSNHVSICHMQIYKRTTSMTATSSCSTAKLLQFVCKIVLQIEQERWRKQKAQSLLHTHTHTAASWSKVGQTSWHVASASTSASASTATPKGLQPQPEHVVYQKFS